jgi:hypothetical protein
MDVLSSFTCQLIFKPLYYLLTELMADISKILNDCSRLNTKPGNEKIKAPV